MHRHKAPIRRAAIRFLPEATDLACPVLALRTVAGGNADRTEPLTVPAVGALKTLSGSLGLPVALPIGL
jgi:hypothetical protein